MFQATLRVSCNLQALGECADYVRMTLCSALSNCQ